MEVLTRPSACPLPQSLSAFQLCSYLLHRCLWINSALAQLNNTAHLSCGGMGCWLSPHRAISRLHRFILEHSLPVWISQQSTVMCSIGSSAACVQTGESTIRPILSGCTQTAAPCCSTYSDCLFQRTKRWIVAARRSYHMPKVVCCRLEGCICSPAEVCCQHNRRCPHTGLPPCQTCLWHPCCFENRHCHCLPQRL